MKSCADIVVVGAGIAGLAAAREARRAGLRVVVLDKGRGVGGRMATRRLEPGIADHGAQFFTVTDARFREVLQEAATAGSVVPWSESFPGDERNRIAYRGVDGMTALPRRLARVLEVSTSARVTSVEPGAEGHEVRAEDGRTWTGRSVVLTPPVPQALAILEAGGLVMAPEIRAALDAVEYDPCLAAMAVLDGPSRVPDPGGLRLAEGPLAWIADNHRKGISPDATTVTLHASPEFSREHLEADTADVGRRLVEAAGPWLGSAVHTMQVHRWRFALARRVAPAPYLVIDPSVVLAGDAFGGPRVEGAYLSGVAAARAILAGRDGSPRDGSRTAGPAPR